MDIETTRRNLLKGMLAVPVLGTLLAALSPFMRFLKPTVKPLKLFTLLMNTIMVTLKTKIMFIYWVRS